jgi:hypothetical protein
MEGVVEVLYKVLHADDSMLWKMKLVDHSYFSQMEQR